MLAELLGATLVDARAELIAARSALESAGWPARSSRWFAEAPPWPPASVAKLRAEAKGGPAPLVATLAEQVAPDPEVRAWLLRSWDRPPRPIDGALLDELAGALDGRVGREPRLRSWLRGEWTAWARQRYRRVARSIAAPPVARPGGNPS